ncbi:UL36 very large tegument protein [Streptomyces sp. NPDC096176]|uniref:UL36 very large tegument protein n=1 Tax=Streptomyces sp. NPDC096176 TaxID=3366079 RepID=UPI00383066CD
MMEHQLPFEAVTFGRYLGELVARLDPDDGWYAVFRQRDPEGMRACLDGAEIPPWDVVESLLQDLSGGQGAEPAQARALHASAAAAHDRLPGGRETLEERIEFMRRERLRAQARAEELLRLLPGRAEMSPEAERLSHELAWVRDDHARAVRRTAELQSRLSALPALDPAAPSGVDRPEGPGETQPSVAHPPVTRPDHASAEPGRASTGPAPKTSARKKKPRKRGGARFAGVEDAGEDAVAVPLLPVGGDTPRGARYGGGAEPPPPADPAPTPEGAELAAKDTVAALGRLRVQGRGGEAHAVICEAAARPAAWLPALADELHRFGLDADWATLLWEAASQPALRLAAAADALIAAGRDDDGRQLLRQGVFRSADEIADAVLVLEDEGMSRRAHSLLSVFVQVRTAEDAAAVAGREPARLVPLLLATARGLAASQERDIIHALRVAGHLSG